MNNNNNCDCVTKKNRKLKIVKIICLILIIVPFVYILVSEYIYDHTEKEKTVDDIIYEYCISDKEHVDLSQVTPMEWGVLYVIDVRLSKNAVREEIGEHADKLPDIFGYYDTSIVWFFLKDDELIHSEEMNGFTLKHKNREKEEPFIYTFYSDNSLFKIHTSFETDNGIIDTIKLEHLDK